ncbi:hypothetical protein BGW41_002982 [Actinomortierella wolfii]|nr:hypothetical protein BGW41_002982 [Actinomortierella wolfii]
MLPSFRTLFGPDVLPKPTIPPSIPRPHSALRPNDIPVTSLPTTGSTSLADASWHREQHPSNTNDSATTSSRPLANHMSQTYENWVPHTHQGPKAQPAQPPLSSFNDQPGLSPRSSSPPPSHSNHPDMRDADPGYSRFSPSTSSRDSVAYTQSHHGMVSSVHYRSSTIDSSISSVSSPPHASVAGSESTPLAMEAMAAMTISPNRSQVTAADDAVSRVDAEHHYDTYVASTYQGRSAANGSGSAPQSPSRSLVRLSIAENRGPSVSPPRGSFVEPAPSQYERQAHRSSPLYSEAPSLLGSEFHPPPDMDAEHSRAPTRGAPHEHDQFSSQSRPAYPPTSSSQDSPTDHTTRLSPHSQTARSYSPKDQAFRETAQAQSSNRSPVHTSSFEARAEAQDETAPHHHPGHYQSQAYSQSHPSLHDQSQQRMHDPVRVLDQRTLPSYPHPTSSLPPPTSSPSSHPAHSSQSSSFPASQHLAKPASPVSPPAGYAWTPVAQNSSLEAPFPQPQGPLLQALSPRLSKNHDGLVHRTSHSLLAHHPERFATSSPSRGGSHSSGQHLRQASAGLPGGHASRYTGDNIISPTASHAYPHLSVHSGIRRPHSARPIGESHSYAPGNHNTGTKSTTLLYTTGSHDYPSSHVNTRPSPYPSRRRTESVPSSPQFSHTRTEPSWVESGREDMYTEKFPRHQRSNTTHGHVGDVMYESFSKVLSSASSDLRDRPSFQPSVNLAPPSSLAQSKHDPRKVIDTSTAGYSTIRPSASEPDLERVHGGRPVVQTNGQADYWAKPSFDMDERMYNDRLVEGRGSAAPFRKEAAQMHAQEGYNEQRETVGEIVDEGGEDEEENEEREQDDEGEDDEDGRHAWAQQDFDDAQGRTYHLNSESYRYDDASYGGHPPHSFNAEDRHPSDMDGSSSAGHPPLYAPHPYQPLQQYLLRPQRVPKSPKQKPLQPKNSQRGPYLTRQRVLASGMEPGKGTACRYVCNFCQKRFSRPSSLRIHIYSHTGERPFKCTEKGCERQFSVQSNMRRHLRVHRMDKIKFLDPIYPSQIASERPTQPRSQQQQQQQAPQTQSLPQHPPAVDHRMAPPLPLIGTSAPTPIHS